MKVYLAATYGAKERVQRAAEGFRNAFDVVSTWHDREEPADPNWAQIALDDYHEVSQADVLIAFVNMGRSSTGGMDAEIGYATALGKPVLVVAEGITGFQHAAPNVTVVPNAKGLLEALGRVQPSAASLQAAPPSPPPSVAKATTRKQQPITRGVLDYFPDAILAVAHCSWMGNEQHNPGQPLHWAREKSTDQADCLVRHLLERGTRDDDGVRHSAKVAWRALALLQLEIEADRA